MGRAAFVANVRSVHKILFGKPKKKHMGDIRSQKWIMEGQNVKLWTGDRRVRNGGLL